MGSPASIPQPAGKWRPEHTAVVLAREAAPRPRGLCGVVKAALRLRLDVVSQRAAVHDSICGRLGIKPVASVVMRYAFDRREAADAAYRLFTLEVQEALPPFHARELRGLALDLKKFADGHIALDQLREKHAPLFEVPGPHASAVDGALVPGNPRQLTRLELALEGVPAPHRLDALPRATRAAVREQARQWKDALLVTLESDDGRAVKGAYRFDDKLVGPLPALEVMQEDGGWVAHRRAVELGDVYRVGAIEFEVAQLGCGGRGDLVRLESDDIEWFQDRMNSAKPAGRTDDWPDGDTLRVTMPRRLVDKPYWLDAKHTVSIFVKVERLPELGPVHEKRRPKAP